MAGDFSGLSAFCEALSGGFASSLRELNLARGSFERLPLPPAWAGLTALDLGGL